MCCFVAAAMLVATMPAVAFAQAGDEATMNRLNEEGFQEFRAGRFAVAAQKFREAYAASPSPNLRKNEAVAWFKAEKCDEAIPAANAFLIAPRTSEPDRLEARSIIANCKVEMAREAINSDSYSLATRLLDEAESLEPDQYARDQIAMARVDLAAHQSSSPKQTSPVGWVLVGTGAAMLGGSLVYWALTIPDRKKSNELSPSDPEYDSVSKRASTSRWLVPVTLAGGAAMAGIGIYLVVGSTGKDSGKTAMAGFTYRW